MSLLLVIDTSGHSCRVGLANEGRLLARRIGENSRQAAQQVLPLIKDVMVEGQFELNELDALAVISGPGSFTGLRIGIGVAQALSFTQSIPVVAVSSLALQAWSGMKQQGVLECLVFEEAKAPEFYFAHYRCDQAKGAQLLGREQVGALEDLLIPVAFTSPEKLPKQAGLLGSVCATASILGQVAGGVPVYPEVLSSLEEFCELATLKFQHKEVSREPVQPNYVKEQMEYS